MGIFDLEYNKYGLESIDFQYEDKAPKKVISLFTKIQKLVNEGNETNNIEIIESIKNIEELVNNRFGVKIKIKDNNKLDYYVYVPVPKSYHILMENGKVSYKLLLSGDRKYFRLIENFNKDLNNEEIKVDLKNAKMQSPSIKPNIYMDIVNGFVKLKLSPEEMTAILFHEIGHIFTYVEYMNRSITANRVIMDVINNNKKRSNLITEFNYKMSYAVTNKEIKKTFENLAKYPQSRYVYAYSTYNAVLKYIQSATGDNIYDRTAGEQLADQFAVRFGLGKYLVTGLKKSRENASDFTIKDTKNVSMKNKFINIFINPIELIFVVLLPIIYSIFGILYLLFTMAGGFIHSIFIIYMFFIGIINFILSRIVLLVYGTRSTMKTHDEPIARYTRIRNDIIESIKRRRYSKEVMERLINDIEFIDFIINTWKDKATPIIKNLANKIIRTHNIAEKTILVERLIEDMINNDLFVVSRKYSLKY